MNVLGIDPGQSGSIACVGDHVWVSPTAGTLHEVWEIFLKAFHQGVDMAWIESVHPMKGWGVSTAGKFMRNFGNLEAFLTAASIPFEYVTPSVWQGALGCRSKGDKRVTRAKAQQLYPHLKVTHVTADGLLLATYGLRKAVG